jgi:uncharacterized membrane protein
MVKYNSDAGVAANESAMQGLGSYSGNGTYSTTPPAPSAPASSWIDSLTSYIGSLSGDTSSYNSGGDVNG